MNRNLIVSLTILLALAFGLAACTLPASSAGDDPTRAPSVETGAALARTDSQGAVEFVVTPLNLSASTETYEIEVAMNTHSVDLTWDLAAQSTLKTDTGLEVQGQRWPAGSGHHYEGTLTFPAQTADGQSLLEGAKSLILTIRDTDVDERVFIWELSK
jgi:hypothetical protein